MTTPTKPKLIAFGIPFAKRSDSVETIRTLRRRRRDAGRRNEVIIDTVTGEEVP